MRLKNVFIIVIILLGLLALTFYSNALSTSTFGNVNVSGDMNVSMNAIFYGNTTFYENITYDQLTIECSNVTGTDVDLCTISVMLNLSYAFNTSLDQYMPLDGGTISGDLNVTGLFNATGPVDLELNWTMLQNYPQACPTYSYVTAINDSATCTAITSVPDSVTFTGNVTIDVNSVLTLIENITEIVCDVSTNNSFMVSASWPYFCNGTEWRSINLAD